MGNPEQTAKPDTNPIKIGDIVPVKACQMVDVFYLVKNFADIIIGEIVWDRIGSLQKRKFQLLTKHFMVILNGETIIVNRRSR